MRSRRRSRPTLSAAPRILSDHRVRTLDADADTPVFEKFFSQTEGVRLATVTWTVSTPVLPSSSVTVSVAVYTPGRA